MTGFSPGLRFSRYPVAILGVPQRFTGAAIILKNEGLRLVC